MLSKEEIVRCLDEPELRKRLVITPLLDRELQISGVSVDLRLGYTLLLPRRTNISEIDAMSPESAVKSKTFQDRVTMVRGKELRLLPGEFALGATLEYIALPNYLAACVTSRSSWGRAGLVIATAISVAPGFRGVITLELANLGVVPLVLRPGVRIAQILFWRTTATDIYQGRYSCPTMPEFGKVHLDKDKELRFWQGSDIESGYHTGGSRLMDNADKGKAGPPPRPPKDDRYSDNIRKKESDTRVSDTEKPPPRRRDENR